MHSTLAHTISRQKTLQKLRRNQAIKRKNSKIEIRQVFGMQIRDIRIGTSHQAPAPPSSKCGECNAHIRVLYIFHILERAPSLSESHSHSPSHSWRPKMSRTTPENARTFRQCTVAAAAAAGPTPRSCCYYSTARRNFHLQLFFRSAPSTPRYGCKPRRTLWEIWHIFHQARRQYAATLSLHAHVVEQTNRGEGGHGEFSLTPGRLLWILRGNCHCTRGVVGRDHGNAKTAQRNSAAHAGKMSRDKRSQFSAPPIYTIVITFWHRNPFVFLFIVALCEYSARYHPAKCMRKKPVTRETRGGHFSRPLPQEKTV